MPYRAIGHVIEGVFDVPAGPTELMRLDVAVDVTDVPVAWFQQHVIAQFKRWTACIGTLSVRDDDDGTEVSNMGMRGIETLYFGRRPNVIRVYNKVAERRAAYERLRRRAHAEAKRQAMQQAVDTPFEFAFPDFETSFAPEVRFVSVSGTVVLDIGDFRKVGHPSICGGNGTLPNSITRVERQISGGRVPEQIGTFGRLRSLADFDPFERLKFLDGEKAAPNPDQYRFDEFAKGMFVRMLIEQHGYHRARQELKRLSPTNVNRILERYREFLPGDTRVTKEDLLAKYRESVSVQLAA
jgi:hypothetical protein